ncbi:MAG: hypothetical protein PHV60_08970 [bacterium]|nr:hypothetical protein [bacterium]
MNSILESEPFIISIFLSIGFAYLAESFKSGFLSGRKSSKFRRVVPVESIFKKETLSDSLIIRADMVCSKICWIGFVFSLLSIPIYFFTTVDIFVNIALLILILVFPFRIIFIGYYRNHLDKLGK